MTKRSPEIVSGFRAARRDDRHWRGMQTALGMVLLLSIAFAASVLAIQTVQSVVHSGNTRVREYGQGKQGVPVTSTDGGFRAVFPAEPTAGNEHVPGNAGRNANRLKVTVGKVEFVVSWFDLGGIPSDPTAVLSLLGSAIARDYSARIGDKGIHTEPTPRHDLSLLLPDNTVMLVRQEIVGSRVYQVRVTADEPEYDAFRRLADSIETAGTAVAPG
jgi:hypothetical protein